MKKALITGISGQDGSYLAEFLLDKGYEVHGIKRRASSFNTARIDHIYQSPDMTDKKLYLHYGDLVDSSNLISLITEIRPDEVYNLAAQSHVKVSFENPEYTVEVNGVGTLRLLEAIRLCGLADSTRFYQASTSELFGKVIQTPQTESTPFYPRSPYSCAKLFAYWIVVNYREAYGMYACNGILFNHESPRRGETFVTRKITRGMARCLLGLNNDLSLGNLNALRDWGHARDYVRMQWLMLQRDKPDDFIIATGQQISVRKFCQLAAKSFGIDLVFNGKELYEKGIVRGIDYLLLHKKYKIAPEMVALKPGDTLIHVDKRYFRPTEVETLLGDATKSREKLGWQPSISIDELVEEMVGEDMTLALKDALLKKSGFKIVEPME